MTVGACFRRGAEVLQLTPHQRARRFQQGGDVEPLNPWEGS
jgi:hypothetical protein